MEASSDFRDLLRALSDAQAEFLIVGAYAVVHYTRPRFTKDIDLWVRPTPENARRVRRALAQFGAPVADLSEADLSNPSTIFQIGVEPVRADILVGLGDLDFEEAWRAAVAADFGGVPVRVLGLEHLRISKKKAGRPQDFLDLEALDAVARRQAPPRQ